MKRYTITVTEETMRVIANACDQVPARTDNRDALIARQVALTMLHTLLPDDYPRPRRWADEPLPEIREEQYD